MYGNITDMGNYTYNVSDNTIIPQFKIHANFIQNAAFPNNCYWFCTNTGVLAYNKNGLQLNNGEPYFKNYNISFVFKDRENNFWISTINNGLLFVKNIETQLLCKDIEPSKSYTVKNTLYVATNKGNVFNVDLFK